MKKVICTAIVALSLGSVQVLAGPGDGEIIEVEAPDLSGTGAPVLPPTTIGGIIGVPGVGSPPSSSASATAFAASKKTAKTVKDKKKQEQNKSEESFLDWLLGLFDPPAAAAKEAVDKIIGVLDDFDYRGHEVEQKRIIKRDPQTGVVIYEDTGVKCKSTLVNSKQEDPCTKIIVQPYKDPSQPSVKFYKLTLRTVKGVYDPSNVGADASGYVLVDNMSTSMDFIFKDEAQLKNQLMGLWNL